MFCAAGGSLLAGRTFESNYTSTRVCMYVCVSVCVCVFECEDTLVDIIAPHQVHTHAYTHHMHVRTSVNGRGGCFSIWTVAPCACARAHVCVCVCIPKTDAECPENLHIRTAARGCPKDTLPPGADVSNDLCITVVFLPVFKVKQTALACGHAVEVCRWRARFHRRAV